jgi:hypothetical protein
MADDGKVTLGPANFRESFSGRVKIDTAFAMPIYKSFKVIKKTSYRETVGPCNTANDDDLEILEDSTSIETEAACRYECDSRPECEAFTYVPKTDSESAKCAAIKLKSGKTFTVGDEKEGGACYKKVKDGFED